MPTGSVDVFSALEQGSDLAELVFFLCCDGVLKKKVLRLNKLCASLVAQRLKRLPGMRETRARSLGWEDPLEKEMATHSSTLAWRIPWREEPGRLQSLGSQRGGHD